MRYLTAHRVDGDLYDVTYSDDRGSERLPWRSIERTARDLGYAEIRVDRTSHRGPGESQYETVQVTDQAASQLSGKP